MVHLLLNENIMACGILRSGGAKFTLSNEKVTCENCTKFIVRQMLRGK